MNVLRIAFEKVYISTICALFLVASVLNPVLMRGLARKLYSSFSRKANSEKDKVAAIYVGASDLYYGNFFEASGYIRLVMLGGVRLSSSAGELVESRIRLYSFLIIYFSTIKSSLIASVQMLMQKEKAEPMTLGNIVRHFSGDGIMPLLMYELGKSLDYDNQIGRVVIPLEGRKWERSLCMGCTSREKILGYVPTVLTDRNTGFFRYNPGKFAQMYPDSILVAGSLNWTFLEAVGYCGDKIEWYCMRNGFKQRSSLVVSNYCCDLLVVLSGDASTDIRIISRLSLIAKDKKVILRPNPRASISKEVRELIKGCDFSVRSDFPKSNLVVSVSYTFCLEHVGRCDSNFLFVLNASESEYTIPNDCLGLMSSVCAIVEFDDFCKSYLDKVLYSNNADKSNATKSRYAAQLIGLFGYGSTSLNADLGRLLEERTLSK